MFVERLVAGLSAPQNRLGELDDALVVDVDHFRALLMREARALTEAGEEERAVAGWAFTCIAEGWVDDHLQTVRDSLLELGAVADQAHLDRLLHAAVLRILGVEPPLSGADALVLDTVTQPTAPPGTLDAEPLGLRLLVRHYAMELGLLSRASGQTAITALGETALRLPRHNLPAYLLALEMLQSAGLGDRWRTPRRALSYMSEVREFDIPTSSQSRRHIDPEGLVPWRRVRRLTLMGLCEAVPVHDAAEGEEERCRYRLLPYGEEVLRLVLREPPSEVVRLAQAMLAEQTRQALRPLLVRSRAIEALRFAREGGQRRDVPTPGAYGGPGLTELSGISGTMRPAVTVAPGPSGPQGPEPGGPGGGGLGRGGRVPASQGAVPEATLAPAPAPVLSAGAALFDADEALYAAPLLRVAPAHDEERLPDVGDGEAEDGDHEPERLGPAMATGSAPDFFERAPDFFEGAPDFLDSAPDLSEGSAPQALAFEEPAADPLAALEPAPAPQLAVELAVELAATPVEPAPADDDDFDLLAAVHIEVETSAEIMAAPAEPEPAPSTAAAPAQTLRDVALLMSEGSVATHQAPERLSAAAPEPARPEIELASLVQRAWDEIQARQVRFSLQGSPVRVFGDRRALLQALRELLRSAADAAQLGAVPVVTVEVQPGEEEAVLLVHDNGPPLSTEDRDSVLDVSWGLLTEGPRTGLLRAHRVLRSQGLALQLPQAKLGGTTARIQLARARSARRAAA